MYALIDGIIFGLAYTLICLPVCGTLAVAVTLLSMSGIRIFLKTTFYFIIGRILAISLIFVVFVLVGGSFVSKPLSIIIEGISAVILLLIAFWILKGASAGKIACLNIGIWSTLRVCPVQSIAIIKALSLTSINGSIMFVIGFLLVSTILILGLSVLAFFGKCFFMKKAEVMYLKKVGVGVLIVEAWLMLIHVVMEINFYLSQ
ncbi:MAG: hypothetical protein DRJ52_00825 [Thermoprotei archaeon]|nr:MAG: hypothetical protein DRJ52_00825 [Thermoprotei archaeon]RLF00435.1 MAG: hypothetical protein DRJ63_02540 [Thermoprotei archaeon]